MIIYRQEDRSTGRFGIYPEIGVFLPISLNTAVHLAVKYQYAFKAGDNEEVSYLSFKIGFAFM
jgi:hypothetical protein